MSSRPGSGPSIWSKTRPTNRRPDLLGRAQLLEGDYRRASTELDVLEHVSPLEVTRATKTYMRDIQFVYVGDTTRVRRDWMKSM